MTIHAIDIHEKVVLLVLIPMARKAIPRIRKILDAFLLGFIYKFSPQNLLLFVFNLVVWAVFIK